MKRPFWIHFRAGALDPYSDLKRALKPIVLPYFDLPRPLLPTRSIFLVQNGLYRCLAYSITCFLSNSTSGGHLRTSKVSFSAIFAVSEDLCYKAKTPFFQNGPFPQTEVAENLFVEPQTPQNPRAGKWAIFGQKILLTIWITWITWTTWRAKYSPVQRSPP